VGVNPEMRSNSLTRISFCIPLKNRRKLTLSDAVHEMWINKAEADRSATTRNKSNMALAPFFFNTWQEQERVWQDMDRQMQMLAPASDLSRLDVGFSPNLDLKETDKEIIVHAELAGVPKENIQVDFENGLLKLCGRKDERKEEKDAKWHRVERRTGNFFRAIALPQGVQAKDIAATHKDGVLKVIIKKPPVTPKEKSSHQIPVE